MKTIKTTIVLLFVATFLSSCGIDMFNRIEGDRNVVSQERDIDNDFSRVKVSSGIDLYIKQGDEVELTVEADENLHEYIMTEVDGNQLRIYVDGNIWRAKARKVYLTVTDIDELKATSGSDVLSEGILKVGDFEVSTTSGADMRIEVDANHITSSSSSGSDLKIIGRTNTHDTSASSGSNLNAYELESREVNAKASSGADVGVYASEAITAKASSGGDVRYKGRPKKVNKKTSSGGGVSGR